MRTWSNRVFGIGQAVVVLAAVVAFQSMASAEVTTTNPSDDGTVWFTGIVQTDAYVDVSSNTTGVIEFPLAQVSGPIEEALLSVNPYGLPIWDYTMDVYGYESADGTISQADASAGTYLGTWVLSPALDFGDDAFFDVTGFLQGVSSPYVGFNLRSAAAQFCSLEFNYGHPSQLTVTTTDPPMPMGVSALAISAAGICLAGASVLTRRGKNGEE
ncbi:MAG: hypothetical protein GY851_05645 [bacterium]|nr:hypothetical protein [bacterium]